jgi:uncharacterized membrane protein YgcG
MFASLAVLVMAGTAGASAEDFSFNSFHVDYTLTRDAQNVGHLHTMERLEAQFPDFDQNHGILRALPQSYEGHNVHLKIAGVTDEAGTAIPFTTRTSNGNLVLQIGSASTYVHGQQTYVITYDEDYVTVKGQGYDLFNWDVNGDQWPQSFGKVTAAVKLDQSLQSQRDPIQDRCFTGAHGATDHNCGIVGNNQGVTAFTVGGLNGGQTLTIAVGFKPGTFAAYKRPLSDIEALAAKILLFLVLPIGLALWFTLRRWWRLGRDTAGRGVIVPDYVPPKEQSVLTSSAIINEGFKPSAITATILDLAVRGFVRIYEVVKPIPLLPDKKTYELELVKEPSGLRPDELQVVKMIFDSSATGARASIDKLSKMLYKEAQQIGKDVNAAAATDGYYAVNPDKAKTQFAWVGFILLFVGFFLSFQIMLLIGVMGAGLVLVAMSQVMPARTAKGVTAREQLLGLKMYMTVAEADRIKALQSPHGDLTEKIDVNDKTQLVKVYERLLPYAMLFGIEKDWIKQFASLYEEPPAWYSGAGSFNAGYFVGSMSGFTSASSTSFSPPSSSGAGGGAGGGGGGGGGGGW